MQPEKTIYVIQSLTQLLDEPDLHLINYQFGQIIKIIRHEEIRMKIISCKKSELRYFKFSDGCIQCYLGNIKNNERLIKNLIEDYNIPRSNNKAIK